MTPEAKLQSECIKWFRYAYPQPKFKKLLFAIPNGGSRNKIEAKNLKDQGVVPGVSDLFLSVARKGFNGMYIEMKYGRNTLSDNQIEFMKYAQEENYLCETAYTFDEFQRKIDLYLKEG